jgi:Flp pilus assembly protein TadG
MKMNSLRKGSAQRSRINRSSGSAIAETVAMAPILAVISVFIVNIILLVYATWYNDSACKDAARAAAQQDNVQDAMSAARAACIAYKVNSPLLTSPTIQIDNGGFVYEDLQDEQAAEQGNQEGGAGGNSARQGPYVKVTTAVKVNLPAPVFAGHDLITRNVLLRQTYAFPLVKLKIDSEG